MSWDTTNTHYQAADRQQRMQLRQAAVAAVVSLAVVVAASKLSSDEIDWLLSDLAGEACRKTVQLRGLDGKRHARMCDEFETLLDDAFHETAFQFGQFGGQEAVMQDGLREPHRSNLSHMAGECVGRILDRGFVDRGDLIGKTVQDCLMGWWMQVFSSGQPSQQHKDDSPEQLAAQAEASSVLSALARDSEPWVPEWLQEVWSHLSSTQRMYVMATSAGVVLLYVVVVASLLLRSGHTSDATAAKDTDGSDDKERKEDR